MSRRARRKPRRPRKPITPQSSRLRTSIGDFVRYEGRPPYVEYYLFRSDHDQLWMQIVEKGRAGEEVDWEEAWRLRRFGLLMLAIAEYGFEARLFLDRTMVEEVELETIIQETHALLSQIPTGPDGGVLSVYWMEDIGDYRFISRKADHAE